MVRDYQKEVARDEASRKAWSAWLKQRVAEINRRVTAHEVLRRGGVSIEGDDVEQFSCPFHGVDTKPSARVYPSDARSPSHAWCFVCQERWDVIALWKKFHPGDKSFSRVIKEIESAFGIAASEMPKDAIFVSNKGSESLEAFDTLCRAAEGRLLEVRGEYRRLEDLKGYLAAGQILDRLRFQVDNSRMDPEKGQKVLEKLLEKIAAKVRGCPEG